MKKTILSSFFMLKKKCVAALYIIVNVWKRLVLKAKGLVNKTYINILECQRAIKNNIVDY